MQGSRVNLEEVARRMREDWNSRAREDANYYVAFGRRDQDTGEFFETGDEIVRSLVKEIQRLPEADPRSRRALEIGCGPGRLMRPLSRLFGEIHGIDVSEEMIGRARGNLAGISHAHPHVGSGADLRQFASSSFDFVYSYAVFQHIPSAEVIFSYLRDADRVLKPGGILRFQMNSLNQEEHSPDTWHGASIHPVEIKAFALERGLDLLALEGAGTQYLWATMRKPGFCRTNPIDVDCRIRRITCATSSEPCVPAGGRFAATSLWVENLPPSADLNRLEILFAGRPGEITFIGYPEQDGLTQVNALLPSGTPTGLAGVDLRLEGEPIGLASFLRIIPSPPLVPNVFSVTDGVDLVSGTCIRTGSVKLMVDEIRDPRNLQIELAGQSVGEYESFLAIPAIPRWEINFRVPPHTPRGPANLFVVAAGRKLGPITLDISVEFV